MCEWGCVVTGRANHPTENHVEAKSFLAQIKSEITLAFDVHDPKIVPEDPDKSDTVLSSPD